MGSRNETLRFASPKRMEKDDATHEGESGRPYNNTPGQTATDVNCRRDKEDMLDEIYGQMRDQTAFFGRGQSPPFEGGAIVPAPWCSMLSAAWCAAPSILPVSSSGARSFRPVRSQG